MFSKDRTIWIEFDREGGYTLRYMKIPKMSFTWGGEAYFLESELDLPTLFEK